MKRNLDPRIVVVTRKTPLDLLTARHGTKGQAAFFLRSRQQSIAQFEEGHLRQRDGVTEAIARIPSDRRRVRVDRDELDRFVFEPDDVVVAVGQDGLVANVAKYLDGQVVIGVNPDRARYDGVLCTVAPEETWRAVEDVLTPSGRYRREARPMVEVHREDGQRLVALNEVFIGHRTHQSAVYQLSVGDTRERQSSSGILVATGTGASGWARSVARQRGVEALLPGPLDARLVWMVREPFPSVSTGVGLDFGSVEGDAALVVTSEMGESGTIFGDGIESDRIEFTSGQVARVFLSQRRLELVVSPLPARDLGRRGTGTHATGKDHHIDLRARSGHSRS